MGKPEKIFRLGDLSFYECPPRWITRDTVKLIDALDIFERKGVLPIGTSQSDMPLWFMDAYKVFISELNMKQES